jgi:photosystem II stability/assembly factor-like uncharacterized protein
VTAKRLLKAVGAERFDVMGLAVFGETIFASGHPGKGSKLPNPVGLLRSDNAGKSWKKVSLQGEVDFHFLHAGKSELYGEDAQTGKLMYSANFGRSWKVVGPNIFTDIAISNQKPRHAYAVERNSLIKSMDSFSTRSTIKTEFKVSSVEFNGKILYAASGKDIYNSQDDGKSWQKLASFKSDISDFSTSDQLIVAIVGNEILVSKDKGKSFKR